MIEIIPAILEADFDSVANRLDQVVGSAKTVQIDICDGTFVPSITWPYLSPVAAGKSLNIENGLKAMIADEMEMPHWEEFDFELHLMVADAKRLIPDLMAIGPARVLFQVEAFTDYYTEIEGCCKLMSTIVEPGVAIDPDTNPEIIFELLDEGVITSVQCMGIAKLGVQGEPFDARVIKNIQILRARYPKLPIAVDGGVTLENAAELVAAGATRLVVGSAIFSTENIPEAIARFKKVI
jgi:ribulose-phosphate 3-epimerase